MRMRANALYIFDEKARIMVCEAAGVDLSAEGFTRMGKPYQTIPGYVISCWRNKNTGECAIWTENAESIPVHIFINPENANKYFDAHIKGMIKKGN